MASKDLSEVLAPIGLGAQIIGGGVAADGAYGKSVVDKAAYDIQAGVAETNATIATAQRSDALRRGQTAVTNAQLRTRQLKGQQIAQMAAHGVALGEGSPLNILSDTDLMGANDANVIALNAAKEAWGFDIQAGNAKSNAALMRLRGEMESPIKSAATSLLTTAGSVASKWYSTRHPYADA